MIDNVFSIEEIIWGKLRGYPPWPGKVSVRFIIEDN